MDIFDRITVPFKKIVKFVITYTFMCVAFGFVLGAWWARSA